MITAIRKGSYSLIRTTHLQRFLYLDKQTYVWVQSPTTDILIAASRKRHKTDCTISIGNYILYDVQDETGLSSAYHLELETGIDSWQGYLLLRNLSNEAGERTRIIPTHEIITGTGNTVARFDQLVMEASYER